MKREYCKITSLFWTGSNGQALRGHHEAQVVAFYLLSSPHANMIGLYYLPLVYLMHDTGLSQEGASKGLSRCVEIGFCKYDPSSGFVWVVNMAAHQVAEELKASDNQCKGVQKQYDQINLNPFLSDFFDRYGNSFHMTQRRSKKGPVPVFTEAPPKPLLRA